MLEKYCPWAWHILNIFSWMHSWINSGWFHLGSTSRKGILRGQNGTTGNREQLISSGWTNMNNKTLWRWQLIFVNLGSWHWEIEGQSALSFPGPIPQVIIQINYSGFLQPILGRTNTTKVGPLYWTIFSYFFQSSWGNMSREPTVGLLGATLWKVIVIVCEASVKTI